MDPTRQTTATSEANHQLTPDTNSHRPQAPKGDTPDTSRTGEGIIGSAENRDNDQESNLPYSIFTRTQKCLVVFVISLTTLLPPFTASIFYPVITLLARELEVSVTQINLTITIYLIVQGIAPSFVGNLSDIKGRRPALLIAVVVYIAGCVGAAVQSSYGALLGMRILQSAGCSGTIALSLATVSDIVTSAERGMYTSYVQLGYMLGPPLGPVIGGLLSNYFGWQAIFWFLAIYAVCVWTISFLFLPETSRQVVGNGSIPPQKWNKTGFTFLRYCCSPYRDENAVLPPDEKANHGFGLAFNPFHSLMVFHQKETCLLLIYGGLVYASSYMVLSTLPDQLEQLYGFNTLTISLCYLASGFGTIISVLLTGRILDWNFRRYARNVGMRIDKDRQQDLSEYPLEKARLLSTLTALALASVSLVSYSWTLQKRVHLSVPLIFLFLQSFGQASATSGLNNLVMDLNRNRPGVASAAMNLTRCWLGAIGTLFATPLVNAVGVGWLGVVIAGVWLVFSPLIVAVWRYGPHWRKQSAASWRRAASRT